MVGRLEEGAEEPPLEFEPGAVDTRLDPVGEVLVWIGHGQGPPHAEFQRERLTVAVDGAEVDESLGAVGVTHGESTDRTTGGLSCVSSSIGPEKSLLLARISPEISCPSCVIPFEPCTN